MTFSGVVFMCRFLLHDGLLINCLRIFPKKIAPKKFTKIITCYVALFFSKIMPKNNNLTTIFQLAYTSLASVNNVRNIIFINTGGLSNHYKKRRKLSANTNFIN